MAKIEVRINPDVKPTGSDLAVVNAARRSFNKRSVWDVAYVSEDELKEGWDNYKDWERVETFYDPYVGHVLRRLKGKDKRLIQFLARGMTADDFEVLCADIAEEGEFSYGNREGLREMLWQWRNTPTHDTPFNHCFISFEVKAPIFVARQLVKHEYLIMSEFSRRYITDCIEFYEPDYWRKAAPNKKQGSLEEPVEWSGETSGCNWGRLTHYTQLARLAFEEALDEGVAPEQARMVLPQSTMTEWTWSGTLGAFAKMCQLRLHPEAQYEARLVAKQIYDYLLEYYPVSAKALVEGVDID